MRKELLLYPRHFGPNVQEILLEKLISSVEGSCSGRYGFVVCVTDIFDAGKGKIREGALLPAGGASRPRSRSWRRRTPHPCGALRTPLAAHARRTHRPCAPRRV